MAFYIITYDVDERRVNKVRKILKKYFSWIQNSVFEGEQTEGKLEQCISELRKKISEDTDSIYVYRIENTTWFKKTVIGIEKDMSGNII